MDLPKNYDAPDFEGRWKQWWADQETYKWDPSKGRDETFVVDTPPPTVSGSLHVGHLFSYSHQDFIVRYQRMTGKNIFFPIGWDDNGLPTERRVQNLLGVKCEAHLPYDPNFKPERVSGKKKGEITPISRKNFVECCDEVIEEDEKAFKQLWSRLGMSYDWDEEYATINEHSRRTSQWSFLELLQKGEIYQDERPVMWDVDFQTAIAQAELEDKEVPSQYNFLNFTVDGEDRTLVVATTRPELLPACVAVLVHPDDDRYRDAVGKRALTPFFKVPVPIMTDPKADPEKGTGVVMVCTFGDQTDVEWWQTYKLPLRQIVGRDGHLLPVHFVPVGADMMEEFQVNRLVDGREVVFTIPPGRVIPSRDADAANSYYSSILGKYTRQAQKIIIALADETPGILARAAEPITHPVKFFEKGDRPLELVPTRQWYTRIMNKKEALLNQGRKIAWHPEYMAKRYEHWVEGLNQDWCLSRQRYFGVPIPVWYKIDELGEVRHDQRILPAFDALPVDPLSETPAGYTEAQRDKPNGFAGEGDVLDTWATSSLSPQIASQWVNDKTRHAKLFPMDMRPQAHDIIRTWAFYTIVKAYLHEGEIPWKNVVLSGWILDPDRKKMSKSQGNVVTPEPLIDQYSADAVRYWAGRARLGVDTAYDEQVFKVGKKLCMKLFNASKFAIGRFESVDPALLTVDKITEESDRAVIAELRPLIERATAAFQAFDYAQALSLTEDFFWRTLCDNYLELAKQRTYDEELTPGRLSACATLRLVHRVVVRLFAPFVPYITEEVWHWAYSEDADMAPSVHRSPWPALAEVQAVPAPAHANAYEASVAVIEALRKVKAENNLSMAAPLPKATVRGNAETLAALATTGEDLQRMLKIDVLAWEEGAVENGLVSVAVELPQA
ncbi:MAG: valine--tRNA ligase [Candidatus Hydrogenedentes bacterium]|nr:valine--tRNA ligase [Candidatus Hydrogenedentota bacterium]